MSSIFEHSESSIPNQFNKKKIKKIAKEQHVEMMTHDIKTRLQALLADSENILIAIDKTQDVAPEISGGVKDIYNGIWRLNNVLQNLSYSLGDRSYLFGLHSLEEIIYRSIQLYSMEADRKNIDFSVNIYEPLVIECSIVHMSLLFNNLISNAVKYSIAGEENKPRYVRIVGKYDNNLCEVSIYNTGIGIEESEFDSIFEKWTRGSHARTTEIAGTGLGLYISNDIVKRHGGELSISSKKDHDYNITRVLIHLPRHQ